MRDDDADRRPAPPPAHIVGQELGTLSIDELDERIRLLEGEIVRLRRAADAKAASRNAADEFFKSR